jgi:hypothetical protein
MATTDEITVTITRTLPRARNGSIRQQTRDALIRQARREYPEHAEHAVVGITYDYPRLGEQRVTFHTALPAGRGL